MADISDNAADWSATAGSNSPSGSTAVGTGLDDNLRAIQAAVVAALLAKGSDIASASSIDLSDTNGLFHDITGTTTITALGTVRAGIWKVLKFEGALTLTHNATSLILPGAADITTADGDVGIFESEGSGNWRCLSYVRASGAPVRGGWVLIESQTASGAASVVFDSGITSSYDEYILVMSDVVPASDAADLQFFASTDGGSSYLSSYNYAQQHAIETDSATTEGGSAAAAIVLAIDLGNGTGEAFRGTYWISNPASTSLYKQIDGHYSMRRADALTEVGYGGGTIPTASAVDAFKIAMSSGNISGKFKLYGLAD